MKTSEHKRNNRMVDFRPDEKNVVYVGEGVTLNGAIHAQDIVVVDGTVDGEVTCSQLIVGQNGVVNGTISVSDADIYGQIGTDISVKQLLVVRSSGRVEGKWVYGEIEVEKGGVLAGVAESTEFRSTERKVVVREESAGRTPFKKPELIVTQEEDERSDNVRVPSVASRALANRKKIAL
jgi:cytoskeletal protein CcmA (bactofilin family)